MCVTWSTNLNLNLNLKFPLLWLFCNLAYFLVFPEFSYLWLFCYIIKPKCTFNFLRQFNCRCCKPKINPSTTQVSQDVPSPWNNCHKPQRSLTAGDSLTQLSTLEVLVISSWSNRPCIILLDRASAACEVRNNWTSWWDP